MKKCIFHVPLLLDEKRKSASHIRPKKMLKAFEEIGYDVDIIMGSAIQRKEQIKNIKGKIKNGVHYDFLYSESSTMPTLLTEKNHLPKYPFLDFGFMKFCKKSNIPVALFYRDIYWRFSLYDNNVVLWKRIISKIFYIYDLYRYLELLDVFYLPTKQVCKYIPLKGLEKKMKELPPGCEIIADTVEEKKPEHNKRINLFYVGGIKGHYRFKKLRKVIEKVDFVKMTIVCRENELTSEFKKYKSEPNCNIKILHGDGQFLEKYYKESDICAALFEKSIYMGFAMPVKLFEYLGHNIPVIATKGTAAGEFVEKNNCGWVINYDEKEIKKLLLKIKENPKLIDEKRKNCKMCADRNTWQERARQVVKDVGVY